MSTPPYTSATVLSGIVRHPLFWLGLGLRIVCALAATSPVMQQLFLPFLTEAAQHGWRDAYALHANAGEVESFPYPLVMLYAFAGPIYLAMQLGLTSFFALSLVMKTVLLVADFGLLVLLASWLRRYAPARILLVYWLSPAIIYISYIHGQLDAVPIALLTASFFYLFREFPVRSGLLLAMAVCSKTNVILALPFYLLHALKNHWNYRRAWRFGLALLLPITVLMGIAIQSPAFVQTVLTNSTQQKTLSLSIPFDGNTHYYVLPALYFFSLLAAFRYVRISRDLFLTLVGFSFALVTLCIPPKPGWYFWFLPYMAYFVLKNREMKWPLFLLLQCLFLAFVEYDRLFVPLGLSESMRHLLFTGLQTLLILHIYLMYRYGLRSGASGFGGFRTPYLIGIGGDSGTGKTTLSKGLGEVLGRSNLTTICGDGMHKWERGHSNWQNHTHLDPRANELHADYFNLRRLKAGNTIRRRTYDHDTGTFTQSQKIQPRPVLIFEGLHAFYLRSMRSIIDLKIFMRPEETIAKAWKINRDTQKRGHSEEKILAQIATRAPDKAQYIEVQEKHADIIFEILKFEDDTLALRIICSNTIYLEYIHSFWMHELQLESRHEYLDEHFQQIIVRGEVSSLELQQKAEMLLPHIHDILYPHTPLWPAGYSGLMCQLVAYVMFYDEGVSLYHRHCQ